MSADNKSPERLLLKDIQLLIEEAHSSVTVTVNQHLTLLYWRIGSRLQQDLLNHQCAAYGKQILHTLCAKLSWSHFKKLIYIAEYLTELSEKALLEQRLHKAIQTAKARIATLPDNSDKNSGVRL